MQNIPLDKAELLAIFLETLVYGMFLSLYIMLLLVLLRLGPAGRAKRRTMLPVGTILFVLATAHLVIDFVRILDGFVYEPGGPMVYFSNIAHPLFTAKTVLYVTQTLIGDGVMIWRCYMVYSKKLWVIVVPGIVLLVNACAGYLVCYELSHATHGTTVFQTAESWITTFFSLTMAINVSCTAVIALRIYMSGSLSGSIHSLMPALIAIVESGALYSSGVMGLLIAYCRNSNGQYPALDVVQPLAGITFSLIVLQIHFHVGTPSVDKAAVPLMPRYQWSSSGPRDAGSRVLAVQVSEETTVDFPTVGSAKKGSESDMVV